MNVAVISPKTTLYKGTASAVTLPGTLGKFTVLENHAPIVAVLGKGSVEIQTAGGEVKQSIEIESGFVEVHHNEVSVCVEEAPKHPDA